MKNEILLLERKHWFVSIVEIPSLDSFRYHGVIPTDIYLTKNPANFICRKESQPKNVPSSTEWKGIADDLVPTDWSLTF